MFSLFRKMMLLGLIIFSPFLFASNAPSTVPDNDLLYVNTLQGAVSATPSGALMYQIPLTIPMGTAGVQPQLSVVYNSQNGVSGILGGGFGLSGLSAISRVGRDFYHDGEKTGITLTNSDKFALDGQRLILTSNGYYDTEMASFSEIKPIGDNGRGPRYFQVNAKDGSTLYYGQTADSRTTFETSSNNELVSQWLINRMEDANGNYIEYLYYGNDRGSGYANQIKEIRYTGNLAAGLSPYNRIVFNYIDKPVQRTLYVAGQALTDGKLLSEIVCYANTVLVKKYTFTYTADKKRLVYMREFNVEISGSPMTGELKFDWQESNPSLLGKTHKTSYFGSNENSPHPGSYKLSQHLRLLADMNGAGKSDVVGFHNQCVWSTAKSAVDPYADHSSLRCAQFCYNGDGYSINTGAGIPWGNKIHARFVQDVSGDGMADIVGFGSDGVYVSPRKKDNHYDGNSSAITQKWSNEYGVSCPSDSRNCNWTHQTLAPKHLSDFDGDGLLDAIGIGCNEVVVSLNNHGQNFEGARYTSPIFGQNHGWTYFDENGTCDYSFVADINGDGRSDIVALKRNYLGKTWMTDYLNYTLHYALSTGNNIGDAMPSVTTPTLSFSTRSKDPFHPFLTDVNGDGKADFVYTTVNSDVSVSLSTGLGFNTIQTWLTGAASDKIDLQDMNGDGLPDIVAVASSGVWIYLNTGAGFSSGKNWNSDNFWHTLADNKNDDNFHTFGDMNGDGLPDLVGFAGDGVWVSLNQANDHPQLLSVRDNLGNQFTAEYEPLSNSSSYTKGTTPRAYPLMNFQGPLLVCTRLTTRANDKTYAYEGAVVHQQGRGFLGFSKITETDSRLQLRQVSEFELNQTYFVNLPKKTQVFSTVKDTLLSETTQINVVKPVTPGQQRILCEVRETTSKDFVTGVERRSEFDYEYGNVIRSMTTDGLSVSETVNWYSSYAGRNYPNRLDYTETCSHYLSTPLQYSSQSQWFVYDFKGNAEFEVEYYGEPRATQYVYNSLGLVEKVMKSSGLEQTFGYAPQFLFQTSVTTPGLGTSQQTLNHYGQVTWEKAVGGQITVYQRDAFGRVNKMVSPDYVATIYTHSRERTTPNAVYSTLEQRPGRPYVKTYIDTLGRTVKTETPNPSGVVITETEYNSKGQVRRTSMPHFTNETPKWTTYTYDYAGRLETETFNGLTTTYSYTGLTTFMTTPAGRTSSKTYNATGDLVSATDSGGTISYSYHSPGLVSTITAPGDAVTHITYDDCGRQRTITDPNAGTIEYRYDAYDRIIWQRDARGNITTNTYDILGRLEKTVEDYGQINYTYITSGPNVGRLHKIERNNIAFTYGYDDKGRIILLDENGLQTKYGYNADGNLETYEYPSGFKLFYSYTNGYQTSIRQTNSFGSTIWSLGAVNALGQELSSTVLGRSKTQQYNTCGQPTRITLGDIMDYTYTYDPLTGNMLSRRNPYNGQNETFTYDNLDRLTSGVTYELNGNIANKSGVGDYTYHWPKGHAVDHVSELLQSDLDHEITYTSFGKVASIKNDRYSFAFFYAPTGQRSVVTIVNDLGIYTRSYAQNHERTEINDWSLGLYSGLQSKDYIYSPYGLVAAHYVEDYFGYSYEGISPIATDHLGSIVSEFNRLSSYDCFGYDAWGRRYGYNRYSGKFYFDEHTPTTAFELLDYISRGYTGHEHLDMFGLINMNGRMYDPVIGRMLSPDPYVPDATYTQDFNRYSYARNNPLSYVDPEGEFITLAVGIAIGVGALMGGYTGYKIAEAKGYDVGNWQTWGYMLGGAVIGGFSGYAGATIAAGGGFMANTMGIMYSSMSNSMGMSALSGGMIDPSVSFGVASFNFGTGEWGYLGKKGNEWYENLGYAFGALANASDLFSLFRGGGQNIKVNSAKTKGDDWWGHSSITDENGNSLISVGPESRVGKSTSLSETWRNSIKRADVGWDTYLGEKGTWSVELNNVSTTAINKYASGIARWDLLLNSCVGHTSRALWRAGIPNMYLFHPHVLNAQLLIRQIGIYSSPYLYQIP